MNEIFRGNHGRTLFFVMIWHRNSYGDDLTRWFVAITIICFPKETAEVFVGSNKFIHEVTVPRTGLMHVPYSNSTAPETPITPQVMLAL
jgi:hypothetical protein